MPRFCRMWALHVSGVVGAVVSVVAGGALAPAGYSQGRQLYDNLGYGHAYGTTGNTNNANGNSNTYSNNNGHNNNNNVYSANNLGYNKGSSQEALQDSYYSSASRYPNTAGYYGVYAASSDNSQDTYVPASSYGTSTVTTPGTHSSPALSALALLGFLYFLNLIQDVLQGNSGRRRRALSGAGKDVKGIEEDEEGHYVISYIEGEPVNGGNGIEGEAKEEREEAEVRTTRDSWSEPRSFSFLEDFFIRLPDILGIRRWQMIDRVSSDNAPMGMSAFISSRVKMISSIMSFLQDPSPARIRRQLEVIEAEERSVTGKGRSESFVIPSPESIVPLLVEVLKGCSPFKPWLQGEGRASSRGYSIDFPALMEATKEAKEGDEVKEEAEEKSSSLSKQGRHRRHSPTSMNAWYSELGGRNKDADGGLGGAAAKAISILGGGDETQQAVKQEAAPALIELSQGMTSSQPHCLQRVLCRLTSHVKQLSLIPRMALQMLSTNLAGGSKEAVKAGLRGENCSQTFSECNTGSSKLGKTYD